MRLRSHFLNLCVALVLAAVGFGVSRDWRFVAGENVVPLPIAATATDEPEWTLRELSFHGSFLRYGTDGFLDESFSIQVVRDVSSSSMPFGFLSLSAHHRNPDWAPLEISGPWSAVDTAGQRERTLDISGVGLVTITFPGTSEQDLTHKAIDDLLPMLHFYWQHDGWLWSLNFDSGFHAQAFVPPRQSFRFSPELCDQVFAAADRAPAVQFLKRLVDHPQKLGTFEHVTNYAWDVSLNDGPFVSVAKVGDPCCGGYWHLAAQPGDWMTLRSTYDVARYDVSLNDIRVTNNPADAKPLLHPSVKDRVENQHHRTITYVPQLVRGRQAWKLSQPIYIRNGDPDEAWRFTGNSPLSPPVRMNASDPDRIAAILADLNAAYNPDEDVFRLYHNYGDSGWMDRNPWPHWDALSGLDLAAVPDLQTRFQQLQTQRRRLELENETGAAAFLTTVQPLTELERKDWWREIELWRPLADQRRQEQSSWHHPDQVVLLAQLYRDDPELRDANPLARVLDFWSREMSVHRDPTHRNDGKGPYVEFDLSGRGQFCAIVALQAGADVLENDFHRFQAQQQRRHWFERLRDTGIDALLEQGGGRRVRVDDEPPHHQQAVFDGRLHDAIVEQIAAWGQLAIWEKNEAELERVRRWIRRALARDDDGGQLAYEHYRGCSFQHRLSLLAVLYGRTSLLEYEAEPR